MPITRDHSITSSTGEKLQYSICCLWACVNGNVSYEQRSTDVVFGLKERLPLIKNLQNIQWTAFSVKFTAKVKVIQKEKLMKTEGIGTYFCGGQSMNEGFKAFTKNELIITLMLTQGIAWPFRAKIKYLQSNFERHEEKMFALQLQIHLTEKKKK